MFVLGKGLNSSNQQNQQRQEVFPPWVTMWPWFAFQGASVENRNPGHSGLY